LHLAVWDRQWLSQTGDLSETSGASDLRFAVRGEAVRRGPSPVRLKATSREQRRTGPSVENGQHVDARACGSDLHA
jgi:hypothetical protein